MAGILKLCVIQECVPSGAAEVRYLHTKAEQLFYVLKGIATFEVAGVVYTLNANEGFHVLAGVWSFSTPPSYGDRQTA